MISSLNGKLIYKDSNIAVIECGGIGFKAYISANTCGRLPAVGENTFLHTFFSVKEDALDLFGFSSVEELEIFKLITSVSGVGPKIGLAILAAITPDRITLAVASGDAKSLTAASGVGIKLAQRIILELKDKIGNISVEGENVGASGIAVDISGSSNPKDAVAALVSLGYSQSDAFSAVGRFDSEMSVDELIKSALKILAGGSFR